MECAKLRFTCARLDVGSSSISIGPCFALQAGNPVKLFQVMGNEREALRNSLGGNQHIHAANGCALALHPARILPQAIADSVSKEAASKGSRKVYAPH